MNPAARACCCALQSDLPTLPKIILETAAQKYYSLEVAVMELGTINRLVQ